MFGGHGGPLMHALRQETSRPRRVGETLFRLSRYFKPFWWALAIIAATMIVSTWIQVITPDLTGQIVDCYLVPTSSTGMPGASGSSPGSPSMLLSQRPSGCWYDPSSSGLNDLERLSGLSGLILRLVGLYVLSSLLTGAMFFLMNWSGQHALLKLRADVFRHLHRLSLGYYTQKRAGEIMSRITNDAETIQQALGFALVNVLSGILLIVWIAYHMLMRSWGYSLLAFAIVPVMLIATLYFSSEARKAFRLTRKELGSVNAELQANLSAIREVQAFSREKENLENFREVNAANRDANIRAIAFASALAPTLEGLGYVSVALVACMGGVMILRNQALLGTNITLGLVVTFIMYVQRFNFPIQQIATLWANLQNAIAGSERMFNLLDIVPDLQDAPDASTLPPIRGRVEFVQVSAAYAPNEPVLNGINFTAEPGQTIAIVGPTGAGKTTMVNLIPRFYDVAGGAVLIDGLDVRKVQARSLRSQIGIVLQDTFLFSTTVMENIRFGRPDASDKDVLEAARLAHADGFIEHMPAKYETVLGERGTGVSQGQRQLLAIARAALASPRILILDEATSSVDTRTERLIQKALEDLLRDRTSFVIAHRLSTIRRADLVLVLDHGRIVERGNHEVLLAQKGFYFNLYMSQFCKDQPGQDSGDIEPRRGDQTLAGGASPRKRM